MEIKNKKAYFDYFVEDEIEAGLVLEGKEVKAIRDGKCNLKGSWCKIINGEVFVLGMHISSYQESGVDSYLTKTDPYRDRKLLLHRREILRLDDKKKTDGITLVPLKLYFSHGKVKMLLGICKGKKNYDKRETIKKRDIEREMKNN